MPVPTLCLLCGNDRPADPTTPCPSCARTPPAVTWTETPRTARWMVGRALSILGALAMSAMFFLMCGVLSLGWIHESPHGRLLQVAVWIVVVPFSVVIATVLPWEAVKSTVEREAAWRSDDGQQRGTVTTRFGAVTKAFGGFNRAPVTTTFRGAGISAAAVFHANLRNVRKAVCSRTGTLWRNQELLVLSALLGMIERDELTLEFIADQTWIRDGADVRKGSTGMPTPTVSTGSAAPPAGWLERRVFEAIPAGAVATTPEAPPEVGMAPFRVAAPRPARPPSARVPLDVCVRDALIGVTDLQRSMLDRVRDDRAPHRSLTTIDAVVAILEALASDGAVVPVLAAQIRRGVRLAERRPQGLEG